MTEEFDYDLTPDQWEALKALRTPTSRLPRMNRYTIDGLITLELAAMNGGFPAITPKGRKGTGPRFLTAAAGSGGLIRLWLHLQHEIFGLTLPDSRRYQGSID